MAIGDKIRPGYCQLCGRRKATTRAMVHLGGKDYDLAVCAKCVKEFSPCTQEEQDRDLWEQERVSERQQIGAMHGDYSY